MSASAALALSSCAPYEAIAAGFSNPYGSATAIGTALAGASARADDAGFFNYNPATISNLDRRQTFIDVRAFTANVHIEPSQAISPLGSNVTGDGGSGDMVPDGLAPGSATVIPLGNGLTFGLGFSVPFATDVATSGTWGGRYQLLSSYIAGADVTAAISWQATPWLALAAGIDVEYMQNRFTNLAVIPVGPGAFVEAEGVLKGNSWAAAPVAGLVLTPAQGTRIGLSWKSGLTHHVDATAGAKLAGLASQQAHYDLNLPSSFSAGLEQRLTPELRIFAEWQWTEWSRFKGFDISYASGRPNDNRLIHWQDAWLAAIGFGYKVSPSTELTAGVSYETGASLQGSGTSVSPDTSKIMLGAGVIYDAPDLGRISLSYAHVFLADAPVNASSLASGTLTGTLSGNIDMIGAGYTYAW